MRLFSIWLALQQNYLTAINCALITLIFGLWMFFLTFPTRAQDIQRIAAIVNDEVISRYDLEQRVDLVIFISDLKNTGDVRRRLRGQLLRVLIDEILQLQVAKRYAIKVRKSDLQKAYRVIEKRNNLPPGRLDHYLKESGVPKAALESQLQASISWNKFVHRRLRRNVEIGEEEVDEVLARLKANAGKPEFRISEIFLPVDTPEQDGEIRRASLDLYGQLRRGAKFSAIAQQFSRGATAAQGGEVGWVQSEQLSSELNLAIAKLDIGEQSEPIREAGGYYIIRLNERRLIAPKSQNTEKLKLKQIIFPVAKGIEGADFESKETLAREVSNATRSCSDADSVVNMHPTLKVNNLGTVVSASLPSNILAAVKDLPVGRFSAPIRSSTSVMVLMVCKREKTRAKGLSRESIINKLVRQRLSVLAQRHLRDLRRSAVVELR